MYASAEWEDCTSKGNIERYSVSRSIALVKQMSGSRSDHLDEDTSHSVKCCHVCKFCKREFSSGRALGGHMRAHGSLSLEAEAEAATDWDTNHHQVATGGVHELLEQLSSSEGDGDSRAPVRDYFLDADNNHLHFVSDSNQTFLCTRRRGKPCKIGKEFGDNPEAARGRKDIDDDYQEAKMEYDEDASTTSTSSYSNVVENGDGNNAHEADLDNAKFKSRGSIYVLRRNRKPSKRLVDRENYSVESMQAFLSASPLKIRTTASSSLNNKSHACSECSKEFSSWKALFGHMRCHPEREWRGIQRPTSQEYSEKQLEADTLLPVQASSACKLKKTSSSSQKESKSDSAFKPVLKRTFSVDSDAESIEAAYMNGGGKDRSFQSWTTGKRSKRSRQIVRSLLAVTDKMLPEVRSFHASSEIKEDAYMAKCLVMLACEGRNQKEHSRSNNYIKRKMSVSSDGLVRSDERDIIYKQGSMEIDMRPYHWQNKKDRPQIIVKDVCADDGSLCAGMNEEDRRGEDTITKTRADLQAGKHLKYECSTCKRHFKSHQALGGHRASHKKVKGCFARTLPRPSEDGVIPDSPEEDVTDLYLPRYSHESERQRENGKKYHHEHRICGEDEKETTSYRRNTHADMKRHECSICHRTFPSGQALGGHKRRHWGGDASETSAVPASATSNKQPAATAVQLDLNLPAPEEYEEFYIDRAHSSAAAHANLITTKSISDENVVPQDPTGGRFMHSLNDFQQMPSTDHISHSPNSESPGSKPAESQAETRTAQNHDAADEYSEFQTANSERNTIINSSRYMQCNLCDESFNSVEALGSHQNTHASLSSTLAGLTPITAS